MLLYLFLFLTFLQLGFFSIDGNVVAQAILEHDLLLLHRWLTPDQLGDLMVFCRTLPGGTALNAASMSGYLAATAAKMGFWGCILASVTGVVGLVVPALTWTAVIERIQKQVQLKGLYDCVMILLRPLVPGLILAAAIMMMKPENFGSPTTTPWEFGVSVFLFLATIIGNQVYHFNAGFMVLLCGIAGWILF